MERASNLDSPRQNALGCLMQLFNFVLSAGISTYDEGVCDVADL
jgi:hypothetical protein